MTPLERGQLAVMRAHASIVALVLLGAGVVAEFILSERTDLPGGLVLGTLVLLAIYIVLIAPARRYRGWGYTLSHQELRVAQGVWTKIETHVPLERVQHIDVSQGPIERAFKVCRLILHTAGTLNSRIVLPGLARTTAESIRDDVRARIRQEDA